MERLISDANEYAQTIGMAGDLSIDSFSDIVTAIDLVQQKQGIAGTTAKEAATTIEGSLNMTKAAWQNLVTSFADPDADIGQAMDNLIVAIVGDKDGEGLLNNIIPAVQRAVKGIGQFIQAAVPALAQKLPDLIQSFLPVIIQSAITLVTSIISALPSIIVTLVEMMPELVDMVINGAIDALIVATPILVKQMPKMVKAIALGLLNAIGTLVSAGKRLISLLSSAILSGISSLAGKAVTAGKKMVSSLASAVVNGLSSLASSAMSYASSIPQNIISGLGSLYSAGSDLIAGLWNGIKNKFYSVVEGVKSMAASLPTAVKKVLGIASPSKVFAEIGKWIPEGLALGIEKNLGAVHDASDAMADASLFTPTTSEYGAGYGDSLGTSYEFNIYAAPSQSAREIAEEVKRLIIKDESRKRVAWV